MNGNVGVSGSVTAISFVGNGSALTNLDPAKITSGTANINISGNAATAATASTAAQANALVDGAIISVTRAGTQTTISLQGASWINATSGRASCITTTYTVPTGYMLIIESVSYYYNYHQNNPKKVLLYTGQAPSRNGDPYPDLLIPIGVIYPLPFVLNPTASENSFSNATNFTAYVQPNQSIGTLFDIAGNTTWPCEGAAWATITGRLVPFN